MSQWSSSRSRTRTRFFAIQASESLADSRRFAFTRSRFLSHCWCR